MPPQQATIGPALMEEVEKTNTVVRSQEQGIGLLRRNSYAMDIDRGRNCYTYGEFGHMAQHCRNRGGRIRIGDGRRLEYGQRQGRKGNSKQLDNLKERRGESSRGTLDSYNKFNILARKIQAGASEAERSKVEVRKTEGRLLREVMVKIGLKRIDIQKGITVEALLDSRATGLVMSSEFARKQGFNVKIVDSGLYFIFPFYFYFTFHFLFFFIFLFLEQLGLGFISHTVTSVTN